MEFRILGPMEVRDGARLLDVPAGRGRALLAMLLVHAGEVVSSDRLIDELWAAHPPATAATVVQGLVSRLRRELEPDRLKGGPPRLIQTVGSGYRLVVDPDAVDASRFKRLVDEAQGREPEVRVEILAEALRLWRGTALSDFVYEPFAQTAIAALDELRLAANQERIAAELDIGHDRQVLSELEGLVADHPLSERLRALQMLALYRAGRQAEALDVYRRARDLLVEELGVEPGPELRELEAAVLRQDPSLAARPVAPAAMPRPGADGWLPRERRAVTVVGLDLTPGGDPSPDAEALGRAGSRATELATEILRRYGARVEPLVGHLLVAFFGFPVAHEDDAVRAVRAALEVRDAVRSLVDPDLAAIGVRCTSRIVVETGDIVVTASGGSLAEMVSGQAVHAAYRLQRVVGDDQVVVGRRAQQLVRGTVVLERVAGPEGAGQAWRAVGVMGGQRVRDPHAAPLVGRDVELEELRTAYRRAVRSGRPVRCTLVGEAGIGKSRLAQELVSSIGSEARVVTGRCASYGQGLTFLPLREALADVVGPGGWERFRDLVGDDDAEQLISVIGLGAGTGDLHALGPATASLLAALATERPLVVLLDDLHWAEPAFLDLVDQVRAGGQGRVLFLCLGRPELLDDRPDWAADDVVALGPLPRTDTEELVSRLAGSRGDAVVVSIVDRSQGNPLFAEQLLAASDEQDPEVVPESLRGLLASRLDRLGPGQRDLLRCVSVAGTECRRSALESMLPPEAVPYVDRHLGVMEQKRLVTSDGDLVRFVHVLVQMAAYSTMTRQDRARLHETYGTWLLEHSASGSERDELVGYHLEQSVLNRRAGALPESEVEPLAVRAGQHLADAGERAVARADQGAAYNLLSRARAMLPSGHPGRALVTQRLAEVDLVLGRFADADEMLRDLEEAAAEALDLSSAWAARLERARIRFMVGPDPAPLATVERRAEEAASFYAEQRDDGGQGRAAFLLGCVNERRGRMLAAEQAFRTSLLFADRASDARERMATRWMVAEVLTLGPTPVDACIRQLEDLAMPGVDHPGLILNRAVLDAMRRGYDEAREGLERVRAIVTEQMHIPRLEMFVVDALAVVEALAGDRGAARDHLRTVLDMARSTHEPEHVSPTAARLAVLLHDQGQLDEAFELTQVSIEAATAEGVEAQALSNTAAALVSLSEGDAEQAATRARAAVEWAVDELPNLRAWVLCRAAEVETALGRASAAEGMRAEARGLYRRKGNLAATV